MIDVSGLLWFPDTKRFGRSIALFLTSVVIRLSFHSRAFFRSGSGRRFLIHRTAVDQDERIGELLGVRKKLL